VINAEPFLPSLVAVIVTVPTATPVTTPDVDTVAIAGFPVVQEMTRPASVLLLASRAVAVSDVVALTFTEAVAGVTVTLATGAETVTVAVPDMPSQVAVIVADAPLVTPTTTPVDDTVMPAGLLDTHVTARPARALLFASRGVAVNGDGTPTETVAFPGNTDTEATGTDTVIAAAPL
jgi:hypothetical protein